MAKDLAGRAIPKKPTTDAERAEVQKFRDDVNKVVDGWVKVGAAHLHEVQAEHYGNALKSCFDAMPPHAVQLVLKTVSPPAFYRTPDDVAREYLRRGGAMEPGEKTWAFYQASEGGQPGEMHLNGGANPETGLYDETTRQFYAHEIGHALDDGDRYSKTAKWHLAWVKEIVKSDLPVFDSARAKRHEGFADFYRLAITEPATMRVKCPQAWAYLELKGLV